MPSIYFKITFHYTFQFALHFHSFLFCHMMIFQGMTLCEFISTFKPRALCGFCEAFRIMSTISKIHLIFNLTLSFT